MPEKLKKTFRNRQPGAPECTGLFTPQADVFKFPILKNVAILATKSK